MGQIPQVPSIKSTQRQVYLCPILGDKKDSKVTVIISALYLYSFII